MWFSKIPFLMGKKQERYLPTAFNESLTLLQKVNKVIESLNMIVENVNLFGEYIDENVNNQNNKIIELRDDFEVLKEWLEGEGLELNTVKVLNEWFDDGRLAQIINDEVFDMKADKSFVDSEVIRVEGILNSVNQQLEQIALLAPKQTELLQDFLDNIPNGATVRIPQGIYEVEKNDSLTGFPNNDQPCLLIRGKRDIKILADGVIFKTNTHAQGILEIQQCVNVTIEGLKVEGLGEFPELDGVTGRGEKGTSSAGYNTVGFWGYYKNNSHDTGLGKFNGGFIGNVAHGLLIHNDCNNVKLINCEAEGFNYSGFSVGHIGDFFPVDLEYKESKNIIFSRCYAHDNYSSNFYITDVDGFEVVDKCVSERAGHPNAKQSDQFSDPGYGITVTGTTLSKAKNGLIAESTFKDCVRKGIDTHASDGISIINNEVLNCYVGGIYGAYSSPTQRTTDMIIKDNKVTNCGEGGQGGFYYQALIDGNYSRDNIKSLVYLINNYFLNCGGREIIHLRTFDGMVCKDNIIENTTDSVRGILVGKNGNDRSYNLTLENNRIFGYTPNLSTGIQVTNVENGSVLNNISDLSTSESASELIGTYSVDNGDVNFIGNYAILNGSGRLHVLTQTYGIVRDNIGLNGTTDFQSGVGRILSYLSSPQSASNDGYQHIIFNSNTYNKGRGFTLTNGAIVSRKDLTASVTVQIGLPKLTEPYNITLQLRLNGNTIFGAPHSYVDFIPSSENGGFYTLNWKSMSIDLVEGDEMTIVISHDYTNNINIQSNNRITWISVEEIR